MGRLVVVVGLGYYTGLSWDEMDGASGGAWRQICVVEGGLSGQIGWDFSAGLEVRSETRGESRERDGVGGRNGLIEQIGWDFRAGLLGAIIICRVVG